MRKRILLFALGLVLMSTLSVFAARELRIESHTWPGRLVDAFALDNDAVVIVTVEDGTQARVNVVYQPVEHEWFIQDNQRLPAWCEGPEHVIARAGVRHVHVLVSCTDGGETYQYSWALPEDIEAAFLPIVRR